MCISLFHSKSHCSNSNLKPYFSLTTLLTGMSPHQLSAFQANLVITRITPPKHTTDPSTSLAPNGSQLPTATVGKCLQRFRFKEAASGNKRETEWAGLGPSTWLYQTRPVVGFLKDFHCKNRISLLYQSESDREKETIQ